MRFKGPLTEAILLRRYFRFLVDVSLKNRKKRTLYCPNLGPLLHCDVLGSRVWFSSAHRMSPGYLDIWELVEVNGGWLVCINPEYSKTLVMEAIHQEGIPELKDFRFLQSPISPSPGNNIDLLLKDNGEQCFMHIEPVFLGDDRGEGSFPEIAGMGLTALRDLMALKAAGHRTMLFYCVQHAGVGILRPSDGIDPLYGKTLREAVAMGVELLAYRVHLTLEEMNLESSIPVLLSEDIFYP